MKIKNYLFVAVFTFFVCCLPVISFAADQACKDEAAVMGFTNPGCIVLGSCAAWEYPLGNQCDDPVNICCATPPPGAITGSGIDCGYLGGILVDYSQANCRSSCKSTETQMSTGTCALATDVCCAEPNASSTTGITPPIKDIDYTLEVPIGQTVMIKNLAEYIITVYTFSISIVSVLAAAAIFFGGIRWASSAGNEQAITQAKEIITGAIIGLLIALLSYIILNMVNPALTSISSEKSFLVPVIDLPTGGGATGSTPSCAVPVSGNCSVNSLRSHGGADAFGEDNLQKAAGICQCESHGDKNVGSGVDKCEDGSSYTFGLFQIHIVSHASKISSKCNDLFDIDHAGAHDSSMGTCHDGHWATLSDGRGYCTKRRCKIKPGKETDFDECVAAVTDIDKNVELAGQISKKGTKWSPWGCKGACGL